MQDKRNSLTKTIFVSSRSFLARKTRYVITDWEVCNYPKLYLKNLTKK